MLRIFVLDYIRSDCAGDPSDVIEREVVGDEAAPAVGSEFDFLSHEVQ